MMHKALHPRDDRDKMNASRKEEGKGIASIEYSVDTSIRRLKKDKKRTKKVNYSGQKQHKDQQNNNK